MGHVLICWTLLLYVLVPRGAASFFSQSGHAWVTGNGMSTLFISIYRSWIDPYPPSSHPSSPAGFR